MRFTVFDSASTPAITNNSVSSLAVDAGGSLWVGMHGGGVARLEGGRFTALTVASHGLLDDRVTSLQEAAGGGVWVGTAAGLSRWHDGAAVSFTRREGLPNDSVLALYEDREGGLWIGTENGLAHWQSGVMTTYDVGNGSPDPAVTTLGGDPEGRPWIGLNGGALARVEDGELRPLPGSLGLRGTRPAIDPERCGRGSVGRHLRRRSLPLGP